MPLNPEQFAQAYKLDAALDLTTKTLPWELGNDDEKVIIVAPLEFPGVGTARIGLQISLKQALGLRATLDASINRAHLCAQEKKEKQL